VRLPFTTPLIFLTVGHCLGHKLWCSVQRTVGMGRGTVEGQGGRGLPAGLTQWGGHVSAWWVSLKSCCRPAMTAGCDHQVPLGPFNCIISTLPMPPLFS